MGLEKHAENELGEAMKLWSQLGDIPVDENGVIEEPYLHFPPETPVADIWHWFEAEHDCSVAVDLMFVGD
jgi:hypothetical protein